MRQGFNSRNMARTFRRRDGVAVPCADAGAGVARRAVATSVAMPATATAPSLSRTEGT
ncbi:MAG: hypothetical protein ACYDAC_01560 [Candidatus Dormibacteria bacterium]